MGIAFGLFKRDAVLYKTLALSQAIALFAWRVLYASESGSGKDSSMSSAGFARSWEVATAIGVSALGFGLSTLATSALGIDRTYFGWEVGAISGKYVQKFPYGTIPHPMIMGSVLAWTGFHLLKQ